MGLPQQVNNCVKGIKTPQNNYKDFKATIMVYSNFLMIKKSLIEIYLPKVTGLNSRNCLECLILISGLNVPSVKTIVNITGNHRIKFTVERLLNDQLIKVIGKPRLILPLQRFKVDKGYVITDKGINVLKHILSPV